MKIEPLIIAIKEILPVLKNDVILLFNDKNDYRIKIMPENDLSRLLFQIKINVPFDYAEENIEGNLN